MLVFLLTSIVDYPSGWILVSSVLIAMALYIASVKTLGRWSVAHTWLFTGLHVLTPTAESLHQIISTVDQTSNANRSAQPDDAMALMKSMEFHHSTMAPGSLTIQALQQQQQQNTGPAAPDSQTGQPHQRQKLPQHPMLRLWKHLEAVICMAVALVVCGLTIQFTMRIIINNDSNHQSTKMMLLGMSWWWWGIFLLILRTLQGLVQTMVTQAPRLQQRNATSATGATNTMAAAPRPESSAEPSWFLFLLQSSPRSVFHGLVAACIATYASSSSSWHINEALKSSPEWYQEIVVRLQLWWNLISSSPDATTIIISSWLFVSGGKIIGVFVTTYTLILAVAEPVHVLQSAMWNVICRQGTLKQQLIGSTETTPPVDGASEESSSAAGPDESGPSRKKNSAMSGFWSARMSRFNLLILPASILLSDFMAEWAHSSPQASLMLTLGDAHQHGTVDMMLVLVWVTTLSLQLHSLLQDYLLGALLLCVDMLKSAALTRQQQQPITTSTSNEEKQNEPEDNNAISSSSLDWISNVFASRPTGLLLTRASQYVLWPVLLLLLVVVAMTTAASSTLLFQQPTLLSPIVYQVATPYERPWQTLLEWNENQFNLAASHSLPQSKVTNSEPEWFAKETWDLLSPQAQPPRRSTGEVPLLSLLKQVKDYAKQSQSDPEIGRVLTSGGGEGASAPPGSVHRQVQECLLNLRFVLAMLCQHSVFSQRVLYLMAYALVKVLCIYWLVCAVVAWIFGREEFGRMASHSNFLQPTLKMNRQKNEASSQRQPKNRKKSKAKTS
mmetsp:Transcript_21702/g.60281  ORF Transcript_21702/g.60281 Transcript_21702/m.60281 type:complete len:784 (-) Transcript_21702:58-2409(-)